MKLAAICLLALALPAVAQDAETNVLYRFDCAVVLDMAIGYRAGERNAVYSEEKHAAAYFLLFGAAIRAFPDREERRAVGSMYGDFMYSCEQDPTRETDSILRAANREPPASPEGD